MVLLLKLAFLAVSKAFLLNRLRSSNWLTLIFSIFLLVDARDYSIGHVRFFY